MIPQIKEINFPEYATLSTATASLVDMGDKTITTQVKIDGSIAPDFSYDWEIEFQGERYIQPLRKPQGSKGNESISSIIDLTFYHKGIYDLKRYFFVSTVEVEAGTLMADNYIVPLRLNIAEFVTYLNNVLKYYYGDTYKVYLNPDYKYDETDRKDIDINYTKIWDVVSKIYEWFNVRWSWETQQDNVEYYYIKIGYPSTEISHAFEYGFEGGLLKFERQVQDVEIANVVFGRGSSENIPYRYFKNKSEDNPTFPADPDWIPELENVYFANLRGKTFRDYVKGWKSNPNRDTLNGTLKIEPIDPNLFLTSFAYNRGLEDTKFAPIEYVKNDISIQEYGEIQKGLEHNEEIKPTIQGVTIDGIGRVDEIVDVEPILVDESTENTEIASDVQPISENVVTWYDSAPSNDTLNMTIAFPAIDINPMKVAHIVKDVQINIVQHVRCKEEFSRYDGVNNEWDILSTRYIQEENPLKVDSISVDYIDANNDAPISDLANIDNGVKLLIIVEAKVSGFVKKQTNIPHPNPNLNAYTGTITPDSSFKVVTSLDTEIDYTTIHGQILGNYESGATRESKNVTIPANGTSRVVFTTEQFTIFEKDAPATSVEMPYRITSSLKGGEYDPRPNVVAIDVNTGETVSPINLPAGTYYLQNSIQITNLASQQQIFKVELLPTYIYYSYDSASWKPTFDIWVKNIWQTMPNKKEEDYTYEHRIWDAILGNHLGDEAKVVFSSGRLSGYSDWEFLIADTPKRDTSKTIDGVPSEWRITLYKSDAEMEATDKWLPSIMTQASAGDHFFFVGIEFPHQYVLWAEERLDKYKREELDKVSDVDSTIVVQLDKVRLNQLQEGESNLLLNSVRVGNNIKVADSRFIQSPHETLHLQSVTYTWDASTIMFPNIEVVLSNDITTYPNPFEDINSKIDNTEDRIKDVRKTSLAQINKAKKSIKNANTNIKALSVGSTDVYTQVNVLIGDDKWMSVREIAEDVVVKDISSKLNPLEERVSVIEGDDEGKSMRAVAFEVLGDVNIEGDLSAFITQINSNTAKIETLVGSDKNTSARAIANDAISKKTTTLEDAATSQDDDGLVTAKDAVTYFASKSYVNRIDGKIAGIEASMSDLEENIKGVDAKVDNAASKAETASQKANTANQTASSAKTTANEASTQVEEVAKGVAQNKAKIEAIEEDYISKGEAVDFATDLTGVIEATPEEFVYRPNAGEKSIRDKSAVIRRIKGNSVVWEQKLKPLTSDNWNQYSATYANIEFTNNSATISLTSSYTGQNVYNIGLRYKASAQKYLSGHVYLIVGLCKLQSGGQLAIEMSGQNYYTNTISASPNNWVSFGAIFTMAKDATTFYIKPPFSYTSLREGSSYSISNVMLFDLTAMFDAGNEPATVEEFRKVYNEAYYPYCQPELRGVKTGAIKTVGFNLFDGNCARVIGGMTYIVSNYAAAYYSETKNGAQTAVLIKDGVYTPECSGYLYLEGTADATPCVHFQHSGVMDDKCAPYEEHILNLPEILKLFPNGMNAVGDVFDEINIDTYIQRCEYRDYAEGDESNAEVLTDGVHTVAKLAEPIVKVLPEPITLDYYCEDWGSEEAIPASSASAPFRADIVYQFNAEGRIRDNSRNIDKLEKQLQRAKEDIQNAGVQSDWLDDNPDSKAFIKNKPTMPTRVATAPEVIGTVSIPSSMLPNVVYIVSSGLERFTLPTLEDGVANAHNVWKIIFVSPASANMTFPDNIVWKDGIAPNWAEAGGYCELAFAKLPNSWVLGEWKIYK